MQEIRGFIFLLMIIMAILATFKGYPFALVSIFGILTIITGWTTGTTAILHPMGRRLTFRISYLLLSVFLVLIGSFIVKWGGVINIKILNSMFIPTEYVASIIGFLSGLFNIDKNMAP